MLDLNNRPGGPNLIVTAKTAHKVHFLDAATLDASVTLDMPGSTHELALSADGRTAYGSVYGDGIFAKRVNPGPPHRGDRPAVEVAHAHHRSRRASTRRTA